ncbi:2411_t:CDS:2 [Rhizophagus irregularis]|nr:2411_t:CDS:2 [Rhizophagus irregularis]
MSLSKKRKELHRDQSNTQTHWKPLELIGVLTFLNENFDLWSVNHLDASNKAIKETNINRDGKALYSKIYNMVKAMEDYVEKNNKSTSYTIINTTTTNQIDVPQLPFTIETIDKVYNEQVQNYDRLIVINRDMIEKRNKEVRELYEQISRRQAELIKLIQKANNKLDELGKITGKSYMI